jgi:hypothetical protein
MAKMFPTSGILEINLLKSMEINPIKDINEVLSLTNIADLQTEINIRKKLAESMLGWLYPNILLNEIHQIQDRITALAEVD